MGKKKKKPAAKQEMSEGKAIAITVALVTIGIIALVYAAQFVINFLFPNW